MYLELFGWSRFSILNIDVIAIFIQHRHKFVSILGIHNVLRILDCILLVEFDRVSYVAHNRVSIHK